jgi:hypothetical protein
MHGSGSNTTITVRRVFQVIRTNTSIATEYAVRGASVP